MRLKTGITVQSFLFLMWILFLSPGILLMTSTEAHGAYKLDPVKARENPKWLNNKTFTGKLPRGSFIIENAHIKNATFSDFEADGSVFRNVIFENCRFYKASMWESEFDNVTFKGGIMTNKGDPYYESNFTDFTWSTFKNVTLDGLKFGHLKFFGNAKGTRLLLQNMDMKVISYSLSVSDAHVRIKNCNIRGERELIITSGSGSVYATDSIFDATGFQNSADVTYVENCKLLDGASVGSGAKTIVIKDSVVSGSIGGTGNDITYLINNDYTDTGKYEVGGIAIQGREDSKIYVDGRNKKNASINILGGGAYIKDLEIIQPVLVRIPGYRDGVRVFVEPYTLDLNNVSIRGGTIEDVRLKGGHWQDVMIYPPVETINAQIKNVQTYNVKFPDGPPWTETDANTKIEFIPSSKPFNFPEIKAPTPQELGLVD